jgi:glutamate N-acetyltransferase/amino-acid N-acetyltransferase
MITVDGDTSTNDMVVILCNGKAGNQKISTKNQDYDRFRSNLEKLCTHLAKLIVTDGEGATKFIEYRVQNASRYEDAQRIVRTISNSNLVKTAIFGRDPNWGRIVAAAGRAGIEFNSDKIDLYIGTNSNIQILKNGQPVEWSKTALRNKMRSSSLKIILDLNQGDATAVGWGCDFSYDYVRINAEYTT